MTTDHPDLVHETRNLIRDAQERLAMLAAALDGPHRPPPLPVARLALELARLGGRLDKLARPLGP